MCIYILICFTADYFFYHDSLEKELFYLNLPLEGNLRISTREESDSDFKKFFLPFLPMLASVSLASSGLGHLLSLSWEKGVHYNLNIMT